MQRNLLDLEALRQRRLPRSHDAEVDVAQLLESDRALNLSRRRWLGLAGAAAAALAPLDKATAAISLGALDIVTERDRVAFKLGGKDRWVIDARRFGGSPRLTWQRANGILRIELTGAKYPGTDIPADLVCEVQQALTGSWMKLRLALGGFEADVPLERWLAGGSPARAEVVLRETGCKFGADGSVRIEGTAEAEFSPDWVMRLRGQSVARMAGLADDVVSDSAAIALLADDAPSLLTAPAQRRTLITLARGRRSWSLADALPPLECGRLTAAKSAFDVIRIEAGEDDAGPARHALAAESVNDKPRIAFAPGGGLTDADGMPFELPLRRPRYAAAFHGAHTQTAFVADFHTEPTWMHGDGFSLLLGAASDDPPFEAAHGDRRSEGFRCEPAVLAISAPLAGAVVEGVPIEPDSRIAFAADRTEVAQVRRPPIIRIPLPKPEEKKEEEKKPEPKLRPRLQRKPGAGILKIQPKKAIGLVAMRAFVVNVIRPEDFLALQFQFLNLTLKTETGQPARLVKTKPDEPAHIVAHFPPQNIGEEAFMETSPEFSLPGANDEDNLRPPPVQSRLAGRSRLVFQLPDGATEVPYTLATLLDWSKYELSVAATAAPPPPPPSKFRVRQPNGTILIAPGLMEGATPGGQQPGLIRPGRVAPKQPSNRPPGIFKRVTPGGRSTSPRSRQTPRIAQPSTKPSAGGLIIKPEMLRPLRIPPTPAAPKVSETAIEAPYRLILSPNKLAAWIHSPGPVTRDGRTELWHTRLGVKSADGRAYESRYEYEFDDGMPRVIAVHASGKSYDHYRTLRAIWSPDYVLPLPTVEGAPLPFRMSLNKRDRAELVYLTANFQLDPPNAASRVVRAKRLMLSSLGAWMDVRYAEDIPLGSGGASIEEWVHRATMGRDQYVRIVKKGYLFPFGHQASLIKVTERKFHQAKGRSIAYLRQRYFIVVRQPDKYYPAFGQPKEKDARQMPLRHLRITTLVTPSLTAPEDSKVAGLPASAEAGFWPMVNSQQDFEFHLVGEDWDGQRCEFTAPVIFVGVENVTDTEDIVAFNTSAMQKVIDEYTKTANEGRRRRAMFGQKVAFAQSSSEKPGDTTVEAESMTFGAELAPPSVNDSSLERANQPRCYPTVAQAQVRIPAAAQIAGSQGATSVEIHKRYVDYGWDPGSNKGQVFLKLPTAQPLEFGADKSGGIATPNLSVTGLSRQFGPVGGDSDKLAGGTFDPKDFFSGAAAKILGGIDLADIIPSGFGDGENVPKLTATPVYPDNNKLAPPTAIDTKLEWSPGVIAFPPIFKPEGDAEFQISAALHTELAGGDSTYTVNGLLTKFAIDLFGFVIVHFEKFAFKAASGEKMDVKPDISEVEFGGPLAFINELKDFMKFGGNSGPGLDITPTGITVSYTLPIPSVAVGVLTIQNISLGAALHIPFLGDPVRLRFNFCERANPFILTVSMFGGGGFMALELGLDGMKLFEASLEFGGSIAIDIGVASGGVYVMAGIYYKWEDSPSGGSAILEGYLRLGGGLCILGIITVSVEFYMGLTYASEGNKVWGEAKLTIKIEILFFSKSVSMTCRREFADPPRATFKSLMPSQDVWADYCEAFA